VRRSCGGAFDGWRRLGRRVGLLKVHFFLGEDLGEDLMFAGDGTHDSKDRIDGHLKFRAAGAIKISSSSALAVFGVCVKACSSSPISSPSLSSGSDGKETELSDGWKDIEEVGSRLSGERVGS